MIARVACQFIGQGYFNAELQMLPEATFIKKTAIQALLHLVML